MQVNISSVTPFISMLKLPTVVSQLNIRCIMLNPKKNNVIQWFGY